MYSYTDYIKYELITRFTIDANEWSEDGSYNAKKNTKWICACYQAIKQQNNENKPIIN